MKKNIKIKTGRIYKFPVECLINSSGAICIEQSKIPEIWKGDYVFAQVGEGGEDTLEILTLREGDISEVKKRGIYLKREPIGLRVVYKGDKEYWNIFNQLPEEGFE